SAAGRAAPAAAAGTHLAAHLTVASAVPLAVPGAAGALRRTGPGVPGLGGTSPRLAGRHAGPRPGDRGLRAQTEAVPLASGRRLARGPGRASRGLDRRDRLRRVAARHWQDRGRPARRAGRWPGLAPLARAAAAAVPLSLPDGSRVPAAWRRHGTALHPCARCRHPRLAERLPGPV